MIAKRFYIAERVGPMVPDDYAFQLGRIATALEGILAIMGGETDTQHRDRIRQTMETDGQTYVRENMGGGRWFRYRIDKDGNVINPQVELANGERIDVDI